MKRILPIFLLACTAPAEQATSSPDTTAAPPAARAARVPDSVLVRRGACPFECCTYGEWTTTAALPVYAQQRDTSAVAFTIPDGTRFRADSGAVHIVDELLIAVHDSVGDPPYWSFQPGDTLVVLDYTGEGYYNVWHDGAVHSVAGFWGAERMPLVAEMLGRWESRWWVHVTLADGRTGWIQPNPPYPFRGADACAGP